MKNDKEMSWKCIFVHFRQRKTVSALLIVFSISLLLSIIPQKLHMHLFENRRHLVTTPGRNGHSVTFKESVETKQVFKISKTVDVETEIQYESIEQSKPFKTEIRTQKIEGNFQAKIQSGVEKLDKMSENEIGSVEPCGHVEIHETNEYLTKSKFGSPVNKTDLDNVNGIYKISDAVNKEILKHILIWTPPDDTPFFMMRKGRVSFFDNNCTFTNCFITSDRDYLPKQADFYAILFSSCGINYLDLPVNRSSKQKYVFVSTEPAMLQPVLSPVFDNFFNWTWTYRLNSDIIWKYITIYDLSDKVVGPVVNMEWPDKLEPINEKLKKKFKSKSKAAAWFVSSCGGVREHRELFAERVDSELNKFGMKVDTYGKCGRYKCGSIKTGACNSMLRNDYYFYLSFENSLEGDYVTEKLVRALNNYVVPVVYGGSNYSRFLPPGSYLDARSLGPRKLAETMYYLIHNVSSYHDFFRWRNHFKYKETVESSEICNVCMALNDQKLVEKKKVYRRFRVWWNRVKLTNQARLAEGPTKR